MSVANVFEEMNLILASEQRHSYAMYGCISPTLMATAVNFMSKEGHVQRLTS